MATRTKKVTNIGLVADDRKHQNLDFAITTLRMKAANRYFSVVAGFFQNG